MAEIATATTTIAITSPVQVLDLPPQDRGTPAIYVRPLHHVAPDLLRDLHPRPLVAMAGFVARAEAEAEVGPGAGAEPGAERGVGA